MKNASWGGAECLPPRLPVSRVVPLLSHLSFMGPCDEFIRHTSTRLVDFMVESQFLTGVMMRLQEELGAPPGWPGILPRVLLPLRIELGLSWWEQPGRLNEVALRSSEAILITCIFVKNQACRVTEEHS